VDTSSVPQDVSPTYGGQRKLMYAVNERGEYTEVASAGWDVETAATMTAVAEIDRQRREAWSAVRAGHASPLLFHMYARRMELDTLAQTTGLWRWRIRRHFDPARFAKLAPSVLARYAEAMGLSVAQLQILPTDPGASL
jgi:hypothetical protein